MTYCWMATSTPRTDGQHDAVNEGAGEDLALLAFQFGHRDAGRDVLRRDHLAHDAAGGIGGGEQHGIEIELPGRDHLQIAEQGVAGRVAARQEHRDPAEEWRQQDEQLPAEATPRPRV